MLRSVNYGFKDTMGEECTQKYANGNHRHLESLNVLRQSSEEGSIIFLFGDASDGEVTSVNIVNTHIFRVRP